jgi:hypothetical protein
LLLLMIANHAHADGTNAFPSIKTLAEECRMSERQIIRLVSVLEKSGELMIDHSAGRVANNYAISMHANPDKLSPLNPDILSGSTLTNPTPNPDISGTPTLTNCHEKDAHIRNEPSLEPKEGKEPVPKRTTDDEILVIKTETALKTKLSLDAKLWLVENIPLDLRPAWEEYVKARMLGDKNRNADFLHRKLGFIFTDFKRDHKNNYERLRNTQHLPTPEEKAREAEQNRREPRKEPPAVVSDV